MSNKHRAGLFPLLLVLLSAAGGACAQSGVAESQQHLRDANSARAAGDWQRHVESLQAAYALNPASLHTRYNLARGNAMLGRHDAALALLAGLVSQRIDFGMADDDAFTDLAGQARFRALIEELGRSTRPIRNSTLRHRYERLDLVPEGIARDASSGRLFFGSMRTGEIFVIGDDGDYSRFAAVAQDGPLAAIGMTVDPARELLWVVGTAFFLTEGYDADAPPWSGVFGFDLASGALREKLLRDDVGHGYNDVTLAPNGDLYLSGAEIGVVRAGSTTIETVAVSEPVYGSNGIVVTADGERLITSAYPSGLAVVDLADGATRFVTAPDDITLYGIDGMYLHDGDLVAVQNGAQPWRLMRYTLSDDLSSVTAARAIEFANAEVVATTGAIVDDDIHYIGQGPAPDTVPTHVPEALRQYLGPIVIMTAPLD